MKLKKLLGAVLSAAMLSAMVAFPANAEDFTVTDKYTADGWRLVNDSDGTITMLTTADYSHSGEYSLFMQFPETTPSGSCRAESTASYTLKADTQYTMGCWIKTNRTWGTVQPQMGWVGMKSIGMSEVPIEETEDGWMRYEFTFTGNGSSAQVWLTLYGLKSNEAVMFDDVYLYEGDSKENLIKNGGFEKNVPVVEKKIWEARNSIFGWSVLYHNGASLASTSPSYVQASNKVARTGSQSLYFHRDNGDSNPLAINRGGVPAGTYTLTFYVKGACSPASLQWFYAWNQQKTVSDMAKSDAGDGWTKYTYTTTVGADSGWLRLVAWGGNNMYIDDISLTREGSDENLISNGSFEDSYVYKDGAPISFVAYPATTAGTGVVSWRNPYSSDITSEVLTVDGEEIEFTPDKTSAGRNEVVLTGLEEKREYECKLSITAGGKTVTETVMLIPDSLTWNNYAGNQAIGPWEFLRHDNGSEYADTVLSLDRKVKYSGNSAMKIQCTRTSAASNVYAHLGQTVTLKKNTTYQFSFMTKYVNNSGFYVQGIYADSSNGWSNSPSVAKSGNSNWTKVTYTIDAVDGMADDSDVYSRTIDFIIPNGAIGIWLDDIAVNPIEDGEVNTSVNLIQNGGFEYDDWSISSVTYQLMNGDEVVKTIDTLESGTILPVVNFKNVNADNLNVTVISAVYKDGKLIDCNFAEQAVPKLNYALTSTGIGASVKVPEMEEGSKYELKVMVWDSFGNMIPLSEATGL